MRVRRPFPVLLLLATAVLFIFLLARRTIQADRGPQLALCPGPDSYGYTCAPGSQFAYIDATQDTQLYADEGTVTINLPFPFTFYGTVYTEINVGSNGTVQFGAANANFNNVCLAAQPANDMGDMVAPYWDDLDLTFQGFLETETVGAAPNRIFVVEWDDIPRFGDNPDDLVTFAVQLFESSSDIVFLYEDVTTFTGHNGSSATIGLQSEAQGLALQFSCNQAAIADAGRIYFPHPEVPNPDVGQERASESAAPNEIIAKGLTAELIASLNQRGPAVLAQLPARWRSQSPPRAAVWEWVDMTGNGRPELILLWYGGRQHPELAQLVILATDESGQMRLRFDETLSTRAAAVAEVKFAATADLTDDNRPDILLQGDDGQLWMVTAVNDAFARRLIPERCQGSLGVFDGNGDGRSSVNRIPYSVFRCLYRDGTRNTEYGLRDTEYGLRKPGNYFQTVP